MEAEIGKKRESERVREREREIVLLRVSSGVRSGTRNSNEMHASVSGCLNLPFIYRKLLLDVTLNRAIDKSNYINFVVP